MYSFSQRIAKTIRVAIIVIAILFAFPVFVRAAALTQVKDLIDTPTAGSTSNHTISFYTPTGIDNSSDTIVIAFPAFDLSSIVSGDVGMTYGVNGTESVATIAAAAGVGTWGMTISGTNLILAAPTDAAPGLAAPGDAVRILIGTHVSGGIHQILNPSSASRIQLTISGTFGDTGSAGIAIVDSNTVSVTASYPGTIPSGTRGDTSPPFIYNIQTTSTGYTSERMTWLTDEQANSSVDYGQGAIASGTVSGSAFDYTHTIELTGLIPCEIYNYRIRSTDVRGNEGVSRVYTFETACDRTPPVISRVRVENKTDSSALVLWSTDEYSTSFVEFGLTSSYGSTGTIDGLVTSHAIPIAGLAADTAYHYRVISTDASGNTSVSQDLTFTTGPDRTPPTNVSLVAVAGDAFVTLTWNRPIESDAAGVRIVRRTDRLPLGPTDGFVLYDGNAIRVVDTGLTNGITYYYGAYAYDTHGNYSSGALASAVPNGEIVQVPVTPGTSTPPTGPATTTIPVAPVLPDGTSTSSTTIPVQPQIPTPGTTIAFELYGSSGHLRLTEDANGRIGVRGNSSIMARVPRGSMNGQARNVVLFVGTFAFELAYDAISDSYEGTFSVSPGQAYVIKVQALFEDGRIARKDGVIVSYGNGRVIERPLFGQGTIPVDAAKVLLYRETVGGWMIWNGAEYGEQNPAITDSRGAFIFEIPAGRYYAEVSKDGFETYTTEPVFIDTNIFHPHIELIRLPQSTYAAAPIGIFEKIQQQIEWIADHTAYLIKKMWEYLDRQQVKDVNRYIFAPAAITLAAASLAPSLLSLLTALQYLFTQPVLLFRRRRKRAYGVVYDSFTKLPIDLAVVRLKDAKTNRIIQMCITDKRGRYYFSVSDGSYVIEVVRPMYVYPSVRMHEKGEDAGYANLHTGGTIVLRERMILSMDIPLDPAVRNTQSLRFLRAQALGSAARHVFAISGVVLSIICFGITPTVPMAMLVFMQIVIYRIFLRLTASTSSFRKGKKG